MYLIIIANAKELTAFFTVLAVGTPVLIFFHIVKKIVRNAQQLSALQKELNDIGNHPNS